MLAVLAWVLAAAVAAVLCLLFLPMGVRLSARTTPAPRLQVDLRLLGGLTPWLPVIDTGRPRRAKRRTGAGPRRPARPMPGGRILRAAPDLFRGLLKVFRLRRLRLEGRYGLGDPAETGMVQGYLSALAPAIRGVAGERLSLSLVPDFERARLDGVADAEVGVRLALALPAALRFAWAVYGPGR